MRWEGLTDRWAKWCRFAAGAKPNKFTKYDVNKTDRITPICIYWIENDNEAWIKMIATYVANVATILSPMYYTFVFSSC